jgi:hypothetical protein
MTKKEKGRLFALVHVTREDRGTWQEYQDHEEVELLVHASRVFDVAQVWMRKDRATAISLTLGNDSGDWAEFVEYCYRPDGTLLRSASTYNTFEIVETESEGTSIKRTRYFGPGGAQLRLREQVRDLHTRKPTPHLDVRQFPDTVYKKLRELPFGGLLESSP